MRCTRRQEAGRGRSGIRSDDVSKHKDTKPNGKMEATDKGGGWTVKSEGVYLCVVASLGASNITLLECKKFQM